MPSNSGPGGVSNLRALFETRKADDQSGSPPSRGRSPAPSDASNSRQVSKVRASFVAVERPGDTTDSQIWGLRKTSDVSSMASFKQKMGDSSAVNGISQTTRPQPDPSDLQNHKVVQPEQGEIDENIQEDLGHILKGSAFESSAPQSRTDETETQKPKAATAAKKPIPTGTGGKAQRETNHKPVIGRLKDALTSDRSRPPPSVKLNTTKDANIIKPPPTRRLPPPTQPDKASVSPKIPKASLLPNQLKAAAKPSPAKPMTTTEPDKQASSPKKTTPSPVKGKSTVDTLMRTQSPRAGRRTSSIKPPGPTKTAKSEAPKPMDTKRPSSRISTSLAAPTAASIARKTNSPVLGRSSTVNKRPPVKNVPAATNTTTKRAPRASLPAQLNGSTKAKSRVSDVRKPPSEGFLARMMRPTASSAQKTHDRLAPSSPPRGKASSVASGKGRARDSLPTSEEGDKEYGHRVAGQAQVQDVGEASLELNGTGGSKSGADLVGEGTDADVDTESSRNGFQQAEPVDATQATY